MPKKQTLFYKLDTNWIVNQLNIVIFLLGFNLLMSLVVRNFGNFVINQEVFHVKINLWLIVLFAVIASIILFVLNLFKDYPVSSILIITGIWSNIIERLVFGGVADYLNIYIALSNLADLQIWIGLISLNLQIWFPKQIEYLRKSIFQTQNDL